MLKRCLLALLFVLPLFMLQAPTSHALSCLPPESRIEGMNLVVEAKITAIPKTQWAELEVSKYLKGSGPAELLVEFRGAGVDYLWAMEPRVNQFGIFELEVDERGYWVSPCGLVVDRSWGDGDYERIRAKFGEGTEPTTEAPKPGIPETGTAFPWGWAAGAVGAVLTGAAVWWLFARKS